MAVNIQQSINHVWKCDPPAYSLCVFAWAHILGENDYNMRV